MSKITLLIHIIIYYLRFLATVNTKVYKNNYGEYTVRLYVVVTRQNDSRRFPGVKNHHNCQEIGQNTGQCNSSVSGYFDLAICDHEILNSCMRKMVQFYSRTFIGHFRFKMIDGIR